MCVFVPPSIQADDHTASLRMSQSLRAAKQAAKQDPEDVAERTRDQSEWGPREGG